MKTITRKLSFTDKTDWLWPDGDDKLAQVFNDVMDIDYIVKFIDYRGNCVQAGGACGVWPLRYSQLFDHVYTFEPMRENLECLEENIKGIGNITVSPCGLDSKQSVGSMKFDRTEHNNYGAVYFEQGKGSVMTTTIDSLNLDSCALIQLDIEGYELEALKGAAKTIDEHGPVIILEEKPLPQYPRRDCKLPRYYLESLGYSEVGRIKKDVVFKC